MNVPAPTDVLTVTTSDGIRLAAAVHEAARDAPTLLLIPGLGSRRSVMDPLIPPLLEHWRVVVYDPRGIGESDMSPPPWTMSLLGRDASEVIAAAGGGRCSVFGASMGGMVAQHLVLDHPDRVSALVLAATTPGGRNTVERNRFARDRLLGKGAVTPADAYRLACTVLYSEPFQAMHPEFIDEQVAQRGRHPVRAQAFAAQNRASLGHDVWDRLPEIQCPVLVMHGTDDVLMPLENARLLASRIPGASHHWFSGGGHLFFHERPAETASVLWDWVLSAGA